MTKQCALWVRALAHWLGLLAEWLDPTPPEPSLEPVRLLMAAQDQIDGRSGEAKRHQVLAELLKHGWRESAAGMAIERVIQERR
jgi:hypothetical protein